MTATTNPERETKFATFVDAAISKLGRAGPVWRPITGDASFRRFHRLNFDNGDSLIAVDAPPATENNRQYLQLSIRWRAAGLPVPEVIASDLENGFFVVTDFGDELLGHAVDRDSNHIAQWMSQALDLIHRIQALPIDGTCPPYDEARFRMELGLFREWFVDKLLQLDLGEHFPRLWDDSVELLVRNALSQARCTVHRDFHSRNLLLQNDSVRIVDYQDALVGPYAYDLVSLLKDCYRVWPSARVEQWKSNYRARALSRFGTDALKNFERDFDLVGMQRHLKAIGIFARLQVRDGRPSYLSDIPRVLDYIEAVARRYPELKDWLKVCSQAREALTRYQNGL